jgi:hypothetical protein
MNSKPRFTEDFKSDASIKENIMKFWAIKPQRFLKIELSATVR